MPQLFSAIKKTYLQVKPYNSEKLAYKLILIFFAIYKKNIKLSNIVDYVYKVYLVNYIYLKLQNILLVMYKWKQNLSESVYLIMKD